MSWVVVRFNLGLKKSELTALSIRMSLVSIQFVEGSLQMCNRSLRCGGWIVEFVRQTRGHRAERSQLFALQ